MPILSSKGQITIPKKLRLAHNWQRGQKLQIIDKGDGVLVKPASFFAETTLDQVAACLPCHGKAKTPEKMDEAIRRGAAERACRSHD